MQLNFDAEWARLNIPIPTEATRGPSSWSLEEANFWTRALKLFVEEDRGHATPCWIFQGSTNNYGYGNIRGCRIWGTRKSGYRPGIPSTKLWHVAMFLLWKGDIPPNFEVAHACHVQACGNPALLMTMSVSAHRRYDARHAKRTSMVGNDDSVGD